MVMERFVLFGPAHFVTLGVVALASWLAFKLGQSRWACTANAVIGGGLALIALILWTLRLWDGFQVSQDLPLWLCDLIFGLCVLSFFRPSLTSLAFVTYWGLAGTLQAILTPDLEGAFPSIEFILFFFGHAAIIVAIFFLLAKNPQPRLKQIKGVMLAFGGLVGYTVVVGGADFIFGWNYGYLQRKPLQPSILDYLGPWPWYLWSGLMVALVLFIVIAGVLQIFDRVGAALRKDND